MSAFLTQNDNREWSLSELTDETRGHFIGWMANATHHLDRPLSDGTRDQLLSFLRYLQEEEGLTTNELMDWEDPIFKYFISWMLRRDSYSYSRGNIIADVAEITSKKIKVRVGVENSLLLCFVQNGGLESLAWLAHMFELESVRADALKKMRKAYGRLSYVIGLQRYREPQGKINKPGEPSAIVNQQTEAERLRRDEIRRQQTEIEKLRQEATRPAESTKVSLLRMKLDENTLTLSRMRPENTGGIQTLKRQIDKIKDDLAATLREEKEAIESPFYNPFYNPTHQEVYILQQKKIDEASRQAGIQEEIRARESEIASLQRAPLVDRPYLVDSTTVADIRRRRTAQIKEAVERIHAAEEAEIQRKVAEGYASVRPPVPEACGSDWKNWWKGPPGNCWTAGGWRFERNQWIPPIGGSRRNQQLADHPTVAPPLTPGNWYWDGESNSWKRWS